MTKQEAIDTLDKLQSAFRALDQAKAMQAFNALMTTPGVVTTAFNLGVEFGSALGTLRRVFDEMQRKGIQFPSN